MITKGDFYVLLKTLEEPPTRMVLSPASDVYKKLPDTIISRTQRFTFRTIPAVEVATHLAWIAEQEGFAAEQQRRFILSTRCICSARLPLTHF